MTFVSKYGKPPRGARFYDLVTSPDRILQRVQVVDKAYELAIDGNVRAMQWLAQVSGEWTAVNVNLLQANSPMLEAIDGMRAALGLAPLGATQAIDSDATLVDSTDVLPAAESEPPAPDAAT